MLVGFKKQLNKRWTIYKSFLKWLTQITPLIKHLSTKIPQTYTLHTRQFSHSTKSDRKKNSPNNSGAHAFRVAHRTYCIMYRARSSPTSPAATTLKWMQAAITLVYIQYIRRTSDFTPQARAIQTAASRFPSAFAIIYDALWRCVDALQRCAGCKIRVPRPVFTLRFSGCWRRLPVHYVYDERRVGDVHVCVCMCV